MFRLAFHFRRPVSELNITWREFCYWQAYLAMEPPEDGDNKRTAALLSQITNMAGRSLPDGKKVKPEDFLPKKPQTPEQMRAFFKSITRSSNG